MFSPFLECTSQMPVVFFITVSDTRLRLLHLLYDMAGDGAKNSKTRFFYVLYSDKTWVFDQLERAQGPGNIIMN